MLGNYLDMVDMGGGKLRKYKVQRITPRFWAGGLDGDRRKDILLVGRKNGQRKNNERII